MMCIVDQEAGRYFFGGMVVVNSILIGIQADYGEGNESLFAAFEVIFTIIFTFEVGTKWWATGNKFFEDAWNTVDFVIVGSCILEAIISEIISATGAEGDDVGRLIRILRLVRVMRMIRLMGMVDRLATLVEAFIQAAKQVLWVAMLMLILLYMFAVLGHGLFSDNATLNASEDHDQDLFRTVPATMLTLFQLMSQDDWANAMRPVGYALPWSWIFTLAFFFIGALGIMNLVTAVFVEELMGQTRKARQEAEERDKMNKESRLKLCGEVLLGFVKDSNGKMNKEELGVILNDLENDAVLPKVFKEVGIPVENMMAQLELCDLDDEGKINIQDMIVMVETSQVPTRNQDIVQLRAQMKGMLSRDLVMHDQHKEVAKNLRQTIADIQTEVQRIQAVGLAPLPPESANLT